MKIIIILMTFALMSCKTTLSGDVDITVPPPGMIWSSTSERVFIVYYKGPSTPDIDEPPYIVYDYSRDMLLPNAKTILFNLSTTLENLRCPKNVSTYEMTITDNTGIEKVYWSDNAACKQEGVEGYINYDEIAALIPAL